MSRYKDPFRLRRTRSRPESWHQRPPETCSRFLPTEFFDLQNYSYIAKSAIEAKLMELGAFVDELPEYVMVMVGNKRSQAQMENDLRLFLGSNTVPFTTWLYQVLQKLQEVTISSQNAAKGKKRERTPSGEEQDFLNIRAETDGDILEDEIPVKKKIIEKEKSSNLSNERVTDKSVEQSTQTNTRLKKLDSKDDNKQTREISVDRRRPREESSVSKKLPEEHSHRKVTDVSKPLPKDDSRRKKVVVSPSPKETVREKAPARDGGREGREKIVYDARELLNRRKAEKLAVKDDTSKRRRDRSPDDRKLKKSSYNDTDCLSRRHRSLSRDSDRDKSSKDVKSMVHRTSLKRKTAFNDDRRSEERVDGGKEEKKTDSFPRSSKVIRISETVKAEQEILKPRLVKPNVPERRNVRSQLTIVDNERDKERERDGGMSSVVGVTPRPVRPASQQPSSSLLLKAMAEANKSLASAPTRTIPTSRKPERGLRGPISPETITVTLPNHRIQPLTKEDKENKIYVPMHQADPEYERERRGASKRWVSKGIADKEEEEEEEQEQIKAEVASRSELDDVLDVGGENSANFSTNASVSSHSRASSSDREVTESINQWLKGVEDADTNVDKYSCQETDLDSEPVLEICQNISELEPEEPEFVVTLSGLDPDMYACVSDEHEDEPENVSNEVHDINATTQKNEVGSSAEASSLKRNRNNLHVLHIKPQNTNTANEVNDNKLNPVVKSLERCKYWPNCLVGEKCSFFHPTTHCKLFPACKYGESCLFIHPTCKFGNSCTRRDCPYKHATIAPIITKAKVNVINGIGVVQNCRFYPNCSNVNCPFYHPKPCHFGNYCTKKNCPFDHSQGLSNSKLKWTRTQQ